MNEYTDRKSLKNKLDEYISNDSNLMRFMRMLYETKNLSFSVKTIIKMFYRKY